MPETTPHLSPPGSNAAKRDAVLRLLHDPTWRPRSNRAIAKQAGTDHKTVAKWRKQVSGDFPTVTHTVQHADTQHLTTASQQAEPDYAHTSLMLAEMLVTQGLSLEAARRMLARLQSMPPGQRHAAERVLQALLL